MKADAGKIKVAILAPYDLDTMDTMGGAHIHVLCLTRELSKFSDLDIHVVTLSKEIRKDTKLIKGRVTIHYIHSPFLPWLLTSLSIDQYRVLKKIRELRPDIIHAHCTAPFYGFTASLLPQSKFKVLLTVHGIVSMESRTWRGPVSYLKGIIYSFMEQIALKRIQNIIVVSPYVKEIIKPTCNACEIQIIPVGVDETYFSVENNEQENRLLFVGGLEPRKGLMVLLKAVRKIKKIIPDIDLHIVGAVRKEKYFRELKKYVHDNDLEQNVAFLGPLSGAEVKKEYSECSIFVLPSEEESLGLVLVEAMAAGKPVIASNIGGIPYVVINNETGYLLEYGNADELAERIISLTKDDKYRTEMGRKGIKRANDFRNEEITKKVHNFYLSISKT